MTVVVRVLVEGVLFLLCLSSPMSSRSVTRSPPVRVGGVRREILAYADVLNSAVAGSSLRGKDGGMAKSGHLGYDTEPERAFGESSDVGPAAPRGRGSVISEGNVSSATTGFMAEAIRSSAREARTLGFLKHPPKDVPEGELPWEKRPRRNLFARLFRYDGDVPLVNNERACAEYFYCARSAAVDLPDVDDLIHAQEFNDMARSSAQVLLLTFLVGGFLFVFWFVRLFHRHLFFLYAKEHTIWVVHHYERDLKRARGKLEDMFVEKELRDDKIKNLQQLVKDLTFAVEKAASEAESLRTELSASSIREAILRAQIGDQQSSLGARIDYLERSRDEYAAKEVARAVRAVIEKYRGHFERLKAYLSDKERVRDLVFREYQMTGIVSCLEACIREEILIPREKLDRHEEALKEFTRFLDNTEVAALDDEDLVLSPLSFPSRD
ncbi:hypothetical protein Bca52824_010371 [Brassica carinata]|uniref:Uncharacterized protein n=1 Tax=Brassica carinata TaxID=52824 RepID=A0A8X7WFY2_BRACI|nr:hypothetical protein Bca52824_010371 [Brassica carinata]